MAITTALFISLILSVIHSALAQVICNIHQGSSLTPTSETPWVSPSGLYAFGFYPQGNNTYGLGITIPKVPQKTVVWTSNRDLPLYSINSTLVLTNEGSLIVSRSEQGGDGDETVAGTIGESKFYSAAAMLDSGNFVLCDAFEQIIWQSFEYPTDTILTGQVLSSGQELVSSASGGGDDYSSGIFRLTMQLDGNLVQYPREGSDWNPFWASNTLESQEKVSLKLNVGGHLCLLTSGGVSVMNLTEEGTKSQDVIYLARIDVDGIFRLYLHVLGTKGNWSIVWESLKDKCVANGLCGLNGYCVLVNQNATCKCLPHFDFVDPDKWRYGCFRNFTSQSCALANNTSDDNRSYYTMMEVNDTIWDDTSYLTLFSDTKEDCKKSCLEDCNCEAALFRKDMCMKKRLPLRYGRRQINGPQVFVKVGGSDTPISNDVPGRPPNGIDKSSKKNAPIIWVAIASLSFFAIAILIFATLFYKIYTRKKVFGYANIELGDDVSLRAFTFAELESVTSGFREELGRGAFGIVYKGIISRGHKVVAVKRLIRELTEGEREFQTEIKVIGRAHHRNLVQLVGYCLEGPNRLLVYEYMSNGSLKNLLFHNENRLPWDERIAIAIGIAKGISYLHESCETQIIHCDIKPHNVLLDEYMCVKVCDFGLAKLLMLDQTKTYTGIRGTRGYIAPEWHRKSRVTVKVDVYSFGVVLLEIICCRRNIDWNLPEVEAVLEDWVYNCYEENQLRRVVGDEEVDMINVERVVKVGLWCIQEEPNLRPSMQKVVLMLDGTVETPIPPPPFSSISSI